MCSPECLIGEKHLPDDLQGRGSSKARGIQQDFQVGQMAQKGEVQVKDSDRSLHVNSFLWLRGVYPISVTNMCRLPEFSVTWPSVIHLTLRVLLLVSPIFPHASVTESS